MGDRWYARPLVFVADAERARNFYIGDLGFKEDWRYAEDEQLLIVQVSRAGCELILTQQWPDKAGSSVIFVSLDEDELAGLEARGVSLTDGHWGYDLKIAADPDGNQLWFPLPTEP